MASFPFSCSRNAARGETRRTASAPIRRAPSLASSRRLLSKPGHERVAGPALIDDLSVYAEDITLPRLAEPAHERVGLVLFAHHFIGKVPEAFDVVRRDGLLGDPKGLGGVRRADDLDGLALFEDDPLAHEELVHKSSTRTFRLSMFLP